MTDPSFAGSRIASLECILGKQGGSRRLKPGFEHFILRGFPLS